MKTSMRSILTNMILGCCGGTVAASGALAGNEVVLGPIRDEFPFQVEDFNDCTGELIQWDALLSTFDFIHISGDAGQQTTHVLSQFRWTATIHGTVTGFDWWTKGNGRDVIQSDPADGNPYQEIFIENSILQPVTAGAPRINFSALIRFKTNQHGDVVIESAKYEYRCM